MPVPRAPKTSRLGRRKPVLGNKFGKMTAIRAATESEFLAYYSQHPSKTWCPIVACQCDCGNNKLVKSRNLLRGHALSCGCGQLGNHKLPNGEAMLNELFANYQRAAKYRKISFNLSKTEFQVLSKQNCYYCGSEPQNRKFRGHSSSLLANGVDRIDSSRGYIKENCVACCSICNMAKSDLTLEEFRSWALKLANNVSKENF